MASVHAIPPINTANGASRKKAVRGDVGGDEGSTSGQVAHTLTACTRCRQRKTRCDPGLPRCTPCERTNSICEYYDSTRGHNVNRNYVVWLQHKVRELESELERVENDEADDPEAMMRAASVRVHDTKEGKYLGPSSGIAITRLVMQLAKQFTDSKSIKDIVPEQRARQIKELYAQEQAKPTSKVYPLISDVAATDLPNRALADLLVQLYKLKVQPMYPALHEPTLDRDIELVYSAPEQASPYQHFVCRMVIAISLQKMDTQYAGLADSYYLAALKYMERVVKPMDLQTLQCFALMAEYSLLTPTRTAIFYVVGIAVRLLQALGLNEEKTITRGQRDGTTNYLEIDMRRRIFWSIMVMEYGLSHSIGRPSMLATSQDHIDVGWFETCDDKYITPEGIDPGAPRPTLKKWVAIHFYKMRLLQLEIRRKLYQCKRTEPKDDSDPWFIRMEAKLTAWRDAAPSQDEGIGLDKIWFIGRYNTMIVFLYRPSPQVPRPSLDAALKCYDACEYNIYMQKEQILKRNVDLTWIFTQSLFMAINTMLWTLSYVEVRRKYKREAVEKHLEVAMDAIQMASERWPGVASAVQLYQNLITAIMKIYEKEGDIPISASTPSDANSPGSMFPDAYNRSRATSPATVSTQSVQTPPEQNKPPFGYINQQASRSIEEPPPVPYRSDANLSVGTPQSRHPSTGSTGYGSSDSVPTINNMQFNQQAYNQNAQFNSLPQFTPDLTVPGWTAPMPAPMTFASAPAPGVPMQSMHPYNSSPAFDPMAAGYPPYGNFDGNMGEQQQYVPQYWDMDSGAFGEGLTQMQQEELMHSLETDGMEDIQSMISHTLAAITPKTAQQPQF
ncbi:Transcriptional activator protein acu-15 [Pseudocercospora fuligena]|uniref:Transcriptional activator protein acu-15 n=1 Tax=Pseudocercospora fuligena TaxID=685502 RepID=A0A8H6RRG2_9PEZI|nr:Transcriptional activator protein acu-15 [Pseudocercospora fuligena]